MRQEFPTVPDEAINPIAEGYISGTDALVNYKMSTRAKTASPATNHCTTFVPTPATPSVPSPMPVRQGSSPKKHGGGMKTINTGDPRTLGWRKGRRACIYNLLLDPQTVTIPMITIEIISDNIIIHGIPMLKIPIYSKGDQICQLNQP